MLSKKVNCKAMVLKLLWIVMSFWKCFLFLVSPLSDINSVLKNWCCVIEFHESLSTLFKITHDHLQDYSLQRILMEFRS